MHFETGQDKAESPGLRKPVRRDCKVKQNQRARLVQIRVPKTAVFRVWAARFHTGPRGSPPADNRKIHVDLAALTHQTFLDLRPTAWGFAPSCAQVLLIALNGGTRERTTT